MEGIKTNQHVLALAAAIIGCWLAISVKGQNGQINTPCTSSMMTTLTPCLNYITGSRPGGSTGASITECCGAFTSLMSNSMDCACLLVTASVPLPLSLSIPKICNTPLALQCKASGTPLPAPGPLQFATPPPPSQQVGAPSPSSQFETPSPASSLSPQAPKPTASPPAAGPTAVSTPVAKPTTTVAAAAPAAKPTATTAAPAPAADPTANTVAAAPVQEKEPSTPRVHPVLTPSASSSSQSMVSLPTVGLTLISFLMFYS